jgi:hypothetical protein
MGDNTDMEGVLTHTINEEMLQLMEGTEDSLTEDSPMVVVNNTTMLQQWDETSMRVGLHPVCA